MSQKFTFSRDIRLTRAIDFQQVFSGNFRVKDECITLLVRKKADGPARLGFAIARKQLKRAVDRNQIKRLFREHFRLNQHEFPSVDIVVMVRYAVLKLSRQEVVNRIENHWRKIIKRCENC